MASGAPERSERVVRGETLRKLPPGLVAIGSHSVSHGDASRQDAETVRRELRDSRLHLERLTGRRITLLALPYGSTTPEALDQARRAGYSRVFCGGPRLSRMRRKDFVVGRVRVDPTDSLCEFRLKVFGAYCWLPILSRLKRTVYALVGRARSKKGSSRVNTAKGVYAVKVDIAEP
jgi:peptidoglycan/xylan/chitin deacetylase (PgdA/CDA1 family)